MPRALFLTAATILFLAVPDPARAGGPIEGRWQKGNMQIEIRPCGPSLCGTVVKASSTQRDRAERGSGTELIGATLIKDIRATGPGHYRARVFVADRNMHASGRIRQVSPNLLKVSGCILAVICKSGNWTRVD